MYDRYRTQTDKLTHHRFFLYATILIIFAVFGSGLRGGAVYDDIVEIHQLSNHALLDSFQLVIAGYYRPMRSLLWIAVRDVFGWFIPSILHWLSISVHCINCALIVRIILQVWPSSFTYRYVAAGVALTVFGLFPFSYEAVLWASAIHHLLLTMWGLTAVLALMRRKFFISCVAVVMALLSHEMGILYAALLGLVGLFHDGGSSRRFRDTAFHSLPALVGLAVFFFIRANVPSTVHAKLIDDSDIFVANFSVMLQGMAAPLIVLMRDGLGVLGLPEMGERRVMIAGLACMVLLIGIGVVALSRRTLLVGLCGIVVWLMFAAVTSLMLTDTYVANGPRLHYAGSVGIALAASAVVAALATSAYRRILLVLVGLVTVLWMTWCARYLFLRGEELARIGDATRMVQRDLAVSQQDDRFLVLNAPIWFAPNNPSFLIGNEGMQIYQVDTLFGRGMLYAQGGVMRTTEFRSFSHPRVPGQNFFYAVFEGSDRAKSGLDPSKPFTHIYLFDYSKDGIELRPLALVTRKNGSDAGPYVVRFEAPNMGLTDLRHASAAQCRGALQINLEWRNEQKSDQDLTVFVHLLDRNGVMLRAVDADPALGLLALSAVPVGATLTEQRTFLDAEAHEVRIGLYGRSDGRRVGAVDLNGVPFADAEIRLPVGLC
jgi:hypothetical protein